MQNLTESSTFETNIPSIETGDAVVGSTPGNPNSGIVNGPHSKITNRTKWLNDNKIGKTGGTMTGALNLVKYSNLTNTGTEFISSAKKDIYDGIFGSTGESLAVNTQKVILTFPVIAYNYGILRAEIFHVADLGAKVMVAFNAPFALLPGCEKLFVMGSKIGVVGGLETQSEVYVNTVNYCPPGFTIFEQQPTATADNTYDGITAAHRWGLFIIKNTGELIFRNCHNSLSISPIINIHLEVGIAS